MSIEALAIVLNHSRAEPSAKLVLIALAEKDSSDADWLSSCSLDVLSRFAGMPVADVRQAIGSLVALGELSVSAINDETVHYGTLGSCSASCDGSTHLSAGLRGRPGVGDPE